MKIRPEIGQTAFLRRFSAIVKAPAIFIMLFVNADSEDWYIYYLFTITCSKDLQIPRQKGGALIMGMNPPQCERPTQREQECAVGTSELLQAGLTLQAMQILLPSDLPNYLPWSSATSLLVVEIRLRKLNCLLTSSPG